MTYAMTWERDYSTYKYETIQDNNLDDELNDEPSDNEILGHEVISLDELSDDELTELGLISMEYLTIELDSYGFYFSTAPLYFSVSWVGIGIGVVALIAYKLFKRSRGI